MHTKYQLELEEYFMNLTTTKKYFPNSSFLADALVIA